MSESGVGSVSFIGSIKVNQSVYLVMRVKIITCKWDSVSTVNTFVISFLPDEIISIQYKINILYYNVDCRKCMNLIASNVLFFSQVLSGRIIKASKYMHECTFLVVKGIFWNHREKSATNDLYKRPTYSNDI